MDKEQILALAKKHGLAYKFPEGWAVLGGSLHNIISLVTEAIESYKAELLKEVGEPVAWASQELESGDIAIDSENNPATEYWSASFPLYTSDQVAAAVLKATKPLEDQLTAAQEEIERLRIALDCTKRDLIRMRCPDFFEGVKNGYETLFDGHLVNMIGLINDYVKQK